MLSLEGCLAIQPLRRDRPGSIPADPTISPRSTSTTCLCCTLRSAGQVIVLRTQSAGVTSETFADYVVSDASQVEALAETLAEARRESLEVNDQDAALLAGLQQTRSMDVGGDTQPSEAWDTTPQRFQRIWARRLLADDAPGGRANS